MNALKEYITRISPVSDTTWDEFSALFTQKALKKGEFFIRENEMARQIGFLTQGVIRAFYRTPEGTEYNKHFFVPLSFTGGYSSLVTQRSNLINLQALTPCHLFVASYSRITALFDHHPDLERFARKLAEQYFVHKEKREVDIVLLEADKRYIQFQREYPGLEQLIPQYHIASYLGITPTQLSRIRRKMISLPM